ncbi:hypothetical protein SARI_00777 [Salmonella enterica subsp. arizonae serovar 62:z4,z23:-]|uniref:Uncharacterized protein n=1 Tax=Salmonella arizonae (strain ATCC BAA-731 / CDC346-86 / RSK2980) TaxID=41514 RepID=A9MKY1_SALAR|nr:hypothetical protein SARI_00777 [Salmonella enterica subsp. arizonae serovar 62:z4,z23:-]
MNLNMRCNAGHAFPCLIARRPDKTRRRRHPALPFDQKLQLIQ